MQNELARSAEAKEGVEERSDEHPTCAQMAIPRGLPSSASGVPPRRARAQRTKNVLLPIKSSFRDGSVSGVREQQALRVVAFAHERKWWFPGFGVKWLVLHVSEQRNVQNLPLQRFCTLMGLFVVYHGTIGHQLGTWAIEENVHPGFVSINE